jgi:hypothetical protein
MLIFQYLTFYSLQVVPKAIQTTSHHINSYINAALHHWAGKQLALQRL